jgi:hypothetical protein
VRADAADRIFAAPPPEALQPRVSIPRIFALGLVLPFAHLHRLILAGLFPAVLVGAFFLTPPGRAAIDWMNVFAEVYTRQMAPGAMPPAGSAGLACLVLFLAMVLWLCTWQRGAARGFAEPVRRWLLGSLLRFPGYAIALVIWQLAPFVTTLPASFLIGWALERSRVNAEYGVPNGLGLSAGMLTPVQWWVAGIGALTFALLGLWVSARLSPLPALVASNGWRGAFGKAWRASSGHGFGLSVSLFSYTLIGLVLTFFIATIVLIIMAPTPALMADYQAYLALSTRITVSTSLVVGALALFWSTAIPALLLRESAGLEDPLDPATFD